MLVGLAVSLEDMAAFFLAPGVLPVLYQTLHLDGEALLKEETSGKCSEMQNCTKMIHLEALPAWLLELYPTLHLSLHLNAEALLKQVTFEKFQICKTLQILST